MKTVNIPPNTDPLLQQAYDLAKQINARIEEVCRAESPLRWRTLAEREVAACLDETLWRYMWIDILGKPPQIAITEYIG